MNMHARPLPDHGDALETARVLPRRRGRRAFGALAALVLVLMAMAMTLGDYPAGLAQVLQSLLSPLTGFAQPGTDFIVLGVRLPRLLTALLAGAAFGVSGTLFQTMLRNPLASPDIIGITMGASAAAVAGITLFGLGGAALSALALAGALATAAAVYLLAWRDGVSPYRLVLVGIGVAAVLAAAISYMFTRARLSSVQQALTWLTGSLNSVGYGEVLTLAVGLVLLLPLAAALARPLGALQLGDDSARALGTRAEATRLALMATAVALAALATAAVGPVAFVALLAGPIARRLLGAAGPALAGSALTGGAITIGADIVAQHLLGRNQLPVGVVTGVLGALFLIWLLVAAGRAGRLG